MKATRICPVCRNTIQPTIRHNIYAHLDSTGNQQCPMGGQPYKLAFHYRRKTAK